MDKRQQEEQGRHEHPLPGQIPQHQKELNREAHDEAVKDIVDDKELVAKSPNDDLDEGETARLGDDVSDIIWIIDHTIKYALMESRDSRHERRNNSPQRHPREENAKQRDERRDERSGVRNAEPEKLEERRILWDNDLYERQSS